MDKQKILYILQNEEVRNDLIYKIQNLPEHCLSMQSVCNAFQILNMDKPSRGAYQDTILKHTFSFCDAFECFQTLRVVCKVWKKSVENTTFRNCNGAAEWERLIREAPQNFVNIPVIYQKFFQSLKHLDLDIHRYPIFLNRIKRDWFNQNFDKFTQFISCNVSELHSICLNSFRHNNSQHSLFFLDLLKNSHLTLRRIKFSPLKFPEDLSFPNLLEISFRLSGNDEINQFENFFQHFLQHAPNLEVIYFVGTGKKIYPHILKNYKTHCMFFEIGYPEYCLPAKMLCCKVGRLYGCQCLDEVQYLQLEIGPYDLHQKKMLSIYKKYFQTKLSNLKGIILYVINTSELEGYLDPKTFSSETKIRKLFDVTIEELDFCSEFENFKKLMKEWVTFLGLLKSQGIQTLNEQQYTEKEKEILRDMKKPAFKFI